MNINKQKYVIILFLVLTLVFSYFSMNTRMLGEDENTYFSLAKEYSRGNIESFTHTGRPIVVAMFLPLLISIPFMIFGPSLAISKIMITIFGILTLFIVYIIGKRIDKENNKISIMGLMSSFVLLIMPTFSHYSMILYTEIPIAFFSALITYFIIDMNNKNKAIILGIFMGISYYVKFSGLIFPAIVFFYGFYRLFSKKDEKYFKFVILSSIISAVMIFPWIIKNIILFNYPFFEILNPFFMIPEISTIVSWEVEIAKIISPSINYIQTFGFIPIILFLLGLVYYFQNKENKIEVPIIITFFFIFVYYIRFYFFADLIGQHAIADSRYMLIIFPQIALISGFFLKKLFEYKKAFLVVLIAIALLSLWTSYSVLYSTSNTQRFSDQYIDSLLWIKMNTPKDSSILTTYTGSAEAFSERTTIWSIEELEQMMQTDDSSYIYNTLVSYDITHILIWRATLFDLFIKPESNILGAFTYNFLNNINDDYELFEKVYENSEVVVYELR